MARKIIREEKKKEVPEWLGVAQYADYKGVTGNVIQEMIREGRLPYQHKGGRRVIPVKEADEIWEGIDHTRGANAYQDGGDSKAPNLAQASAFQKAYKAKLTELEYQQKKGLLIDKKIVHNQVVTAVRQLRDALRNVPQKVAPEIAAEVDPHKCEMLLLREIDECLEDLSRLAERFK